MLKEKIRSFEINVVLVSDKEIKKLNKKFRDVGRITDVISFKFGSKPVMGDIYIARNRSQKQAKKVKNSWQEELSYLVIHGILHLLDYTDYTKANRLRMFAKQDKIFNEIVGKG